MENMKKLNLLLECLAKCQDVPAKIGEVYACMLEKLSNDGLCVKTSFTCEQIKNVLKLNHMDFKNMQFELNRTFSTPEGFKKQKDEIFISLLKGNFASHAKKLDNSLEEFENSLSDVEQKIYLLIKTYIDLISNGLEFFVNFDEHREKTIEELSEFATDLHDKILKHILFEEEKELMDEPLKQLSVVYIGVYYRSFYVE